ncbi:MAG: transposase, partial [Acidobacteria bacterium]|nr:transposase [Acidobacteriota bacterium]
MWYNGGVKLIVNLKLQPTPEQAKSLRQTLERANAACNWMSEQGWQTQPKPTLKQFALHKLTYHAAKEKFDLTAQMVVRCISKVADAYKLDKKRQRTFKRHGSIAYDDRIIRFTKSEAVNLWTVGGRETIPFQCGDYQRKLLPFRKGEVDLVFRKGNFYLNAVCDVEEPPVIEGDDVIGCDFGIVNLVTTSDGEVMTGASVERTRRTYAHRRRNLQRKQTKSAKRKLKQLSGKQSRYQR